MGYLNSIIGARVTFLFFFSNVFIVLIKFGIEIYSEKFQCEENLKHVIKYLKHGLFRKF